MTRYCVYLVLFFIIFLISCKENKVSRIVIFTPQFITDTFCIKLDQKKGSKLIKGSIFNYALFLDSLKKNVYKTSSNIKVKDSFSLNVVLNNDFKRFSSIKDSCVYYKYTIDSGSTIKKVCFSLKCKEIIKEKEIKSREELRKYY